MKYPAFGIALLTLTACSAPDQEAVKDAPADTPEAVVEEAQPAAEEAAEDATPAMPGNDIFIYTLEWEDGTPALGDRVTQIDRPGYDNQPFFTPDGTALLYTAGDNESGETDIWRLDIASGNTQPVTRTPVESEYSPRIAPNGMGLTYLLQPEGGYAGNATLARFDNSERELAHDLAPAGYYVFSGDMNHVAVFYLGEPGSEGPFTLQLIDRTTEPETVTQIAENPGRTLFRAPRGQAAYFSVGDAETGAHTVHTLDFASGTAVALFDLPGTSQDFVSIGAPDDTVDFLSTHGDQIVWRDGEGSWQAIFDLAGAGHNGVTRLAVSPDRSMLALVAEE